VAQAFRVTREAEASQHKEHPRSPWPQGVSRVASMRISDVLTVLKSEFPAVTHSKLRFLEEQGFISPVRTSSGYRQYCAADLERLRFVLTEQRDRYLPLKVIKSKLDDLDAGHSENDSLLGPRVAASNGLTPVQASAAEFSDIARLAGVDQSFVDELLDAGVLRTHASVRTQSDLARFVKHDVEIVRLAKTLSHVGIDWRHLRSMRAASDRTVALIEQSVAHLNGKADARAQGEADSVRRELAEVFAQLNTAWLRDGVEELS
jgi:DNA-binding transcriptional MerR regulator